MKHLLLTLAIATALFCSCAKPQLEAKQTQVQPETIAVQKPVKIVETSHVCGAKTLDGKTCTRKVADKNGGFCFQHRGAK